MHYFQFEETVDAAFEKKHDLLETARCAGAWMYERGLYVSHGYNELLLAISLDEIKQAVIDHCGDRDEESQLFLKELK